MLLDEPYERQAEDIETRVLTEEGVGDPKGRLVKEGQDHVPLGVRSESSQNSHHRRSQEHEGPDSPCHRQRNGHYQPAD